MEFFEVLRRRRSVRAYEAKGLEREQVEAILMAINSAPSAGDLQAYEVVLVEEGERKRGLARAALEQWFIAEAPMVLVFFAHPERSAWRYGRRGVQLYCLQDATIACSYAQLAATALGLSSCWVGAFYDDEVRRIVEAPRDWIPIAILPVGYAAESPEPTPRRRLEELVRRETAR